MDSQQCNKILKIILGKKKYFRLLDCTVDCLNKVLGEEHPIQIGVFFSHIANMMIVYLSVFLTKNNDLSIFESILNPYYKNYIVQKSIKEFYDVYKEYIEEVKNYISKMNSFK